MLEIIDERKIVITRGNVLPLTVVAKNDGIEYQFSKDDILRFKIMQAKKVENVFLEKDFKITEDTTEFDIEITADEMKIGSLSSKAIDYWYEVELNPDTPYTKTIIGFEEEKGAAILTLLPEGGDMVVKNKE